MLRVTDLRRSFGGVQALRGDKMVGRSLQNFYAKTDVPLGEPLLEVTNLTRGPIRDLTFAVRAGEIVGVAGLAGSGRSALARTLFGLRHPYTGEIRLGGKLVNTRAPAEAMQAGLALVPEDRKALGLSLLATVRENMLLADLHGHSLLSWRSDRRERQIAER